MNANQVPPEVSAVIQECWPDGVIAEFDTDESYFHNIHEGLEQDLARVSEASLLWQTEECDSADWEEDGEPPPPGFQSYHVFFVAPQGNEFEFETEDAVEAEDPNDGEPVTTTVRGHGWFGCTVAVSLVAPFAAVRPGDYSEFEDDSITAPDLQSFAVLEETGERIDTGEQYRQALGEEGYTKLEKLRWKIAAVLATYQVQLLDESILDLTAPGIQASEEVLAEDPPSVRDAFFFHGV